MGMLEPPVTELLRPWLARQRWYTSKGRDPDLRAVTTLRAAAPASGVGLEIALVRDVAAVPPVLYQVPLTSRGEPLAGAENALVGRVEDSELGERWIYDGCQDPDGATALLRAVTDELELTGEPPARLGRAHGHRTGLLPALRVTGARVLGGEQSNTSVVIGSVDPDDGREHPLILKVFRVLHAGANPDVEVQQALALAGSSRGPGAVGDLLGQWPDDAGAQVTGHLALVQEFLPAAPDAWRVTLAGIEAGTDPAAGARSLGVATAEVHATLASVLPTTEPDVAARARIHRSWSDRRAAALSRVPALADRAEQIEAVFEAARTAPWPRLQRIHGDYHLGQVLDVPGRGWVLLDFEGEPLRPLAERTLPDLPLRDVAGMLRSYDYAAGSVVLAGAVEPAAAENWLSRAREAFLDGYAHLTRADPREQPELLRALELDKALYEVSYEAGNRPDWLRVPLEGIERILR